MVDGRGVVRRGHCQAERCPEDRRHAEGLPFTGRRVRNSTSYRVCDAYVASGSVIARSADDNRSVILQTFVKRAAVSVRHGNRAMPRGHASNVARGCFLDACLAE